MPTTPTGHAASAGSPNILMPETLMVILTWVTFFILLIILQKFAWEPILQGLRKRENYIRKSLEDADKLQKQLADVEVAKAKILDEAKDRANAIIEQSRKTGNEMAGQIEHRAKKSADEIINSAHQEIEGEYERARKNLKKDSAQIAISLAEKILKENLDTQKNRQLIDQAVKEM